MPRLCTLEVQAAGVPDVPPASLLSERDSNEEDPAKLFADEAVPGNAEELVEDGANSLPIRKPRGRPKKIDSARQESSMQGESVEDSEDPSPPRYSSRGKLL